MGKLKKRLVNRILVPLLARCDRSPGGPVHFLHIAKTGGTAVRAALEVNSVGVTNTLRHMILFRNHSVWLDQVPVGQQLVFGLRDPVTRFVSAFYSRQRGGRYDKVRDKPYEKIAFETFISPAKLAAALASTDAALRAKAELAMNSILHTRIHIADWLGTPEQLERRKDDILYVYQQETLAEDFDRLKTLLGLPASCKLPQDVVKAHRLVGEYDTKLDAAGAAAIRKWYARDYESIAACRRLFGGDRMLLGPMAGNPVGLKASLPVSL